MKKTTLAPVLAFALLACAKDQGAPTPEPSVPPAQTSAAVASPPMASTTPPAPTETAPATVQPPTAASAKTTASAAAPVAKGKDAGAPVVATKPASGRVSGKNFALELASPGCKVDTDCTMTMKLVTSNEFHVNKEYPYKFLASAAPNVTFLGKGEATTFSKASGDFREEGEKSATMTVRFKPTAVGSAKVAGTYKMSVCSADQCQIEQQAVSLDIPVL